METSDPMPKIQSEEFEAIPDTPGLKNQPRQPAMVLRSRSIKNIAERYRVGESAFGKVMEADNSSKLRSSPCISRLALLVIMLWCLLVLIVLQNIPWGDFELRWVRKKINDVQWLLPLSKQECAAGQAISRPVATCGLPKLANAHFTRGPHKPPKQIRYRHSPGMLDALRIINPSKDYTHAYEFIAKGSLFPLPSKAKLISQQTQKSPSADIDDPVTDAEESPEAPPPELPQVHKTSVPLQPLQELPQPQVALPRTPQAPAQALPKASLQTNTIARVQAPGQGLPQVAERIPDPKNRLKAKPESLTNSAQAAQPRQRQEAQVASGSASRGAQPQALQGASIVNRTNRSNSVMDSVDNTV